MPVSYKKEFIFIHIPKTAGTSFEEYFFEKGYLEKNSYSLWGKISDAPWIKSSHLKISHTSYLHHLTWFQIRQVIGEEKWNRFFKFSSIRNPWERMVSLYFHHIKNFDNPYSVCYKKKYEKTFTDFLLKSKHFPKTQSFFLCDREGNIMVDYLIRFENIEESIDFLGRRLNLPDFQLGHFMQTEHKNYRHYYTPDTKALVADEFQDDIVNFGYEF
jgi:hypothetical protein